jgi:hypothetical protein
MSFTLPKPRDLYDLINDKVLLPQFSSPELDIAQTTVRSIVNDSVSLNELYNAFISGLPTINKFVTDIDLAGFTRDTLKKYSLILIPYQVVILIVLLTIIITMLMLFQVVTPAIGVVMILASSLFLVLFGILQLQIFVDFLVDRETTFTNTLTNAYNNNLPDFLKTSALGYVSASQFSINNGISGPLASLLPAGQTGMAVPLPGGTGPIVLTNPGTATDANLITPGSKLTLLKTQTPSTSTQPAIFYTMLNEPNVFPDQVVSGNQLAYRLTPKPQNANVMYIANVNTFDLPEDADIGVVRIVNASTSVPSLLESEGVIYPYAQSQGVNVYPGEVKCFVNIGPNFNMSNSGTSFSLAPTMWVELTADVRPTANVVSTTSTSYTLRPVNKVYFIQMPGGSTLTISRSVAVPNQELYIIASLTSPGTLTIQNVNPNGYTINNGTTAYFLAMQDTVNFITWQLVYPSQ